MIVNKDIKFLISARKMSYRHISNEPNYLWLDWIIAGKKTYEG